jgi:hypothetical protein
MEEKIFEKTILNIRISAEKTRVKHNVIARLNTLSNT